VPLSAYLSVRCVARNCPIRSPSPRVYRGSIRQKGARDRKQRLGARRLNEARSLAQPDGPSAALIRAPPIGPRVVHGPGVSFGHAANVVVTPVRPLPNVRPVLDPIEASAGDGGAPRRGPSQPTRRAVDGVMVGMQMDGVLIALTYRHRRVRDRYEDCRKRRGDHQQQQHTPRESAWLPRHTEPPPSVLRR
jgi:hypothetical protein